MGKSALGTRIYQLRKEKGITQEELGRKIGVTSQAVSKWECGGTPDAEILPLIAKCFNVSIDNLYGHTDEMKQNLGLEIMWNLYNTEKEKRFEKASEYCLSILYGLSDIEPEILLGVMKDKVSIPDVSKTFSAVYFDEGVAFARMNKEVQNFFLLPTPPEGMRNAILEPEAYERFFSLLGKQGRMKMLLFMYKRKARAVSASRVAQLLNMKKEEVEKIMQDLCELKLIYKVNMDSEDGEEYLYMIIPYLANITLLLSFLVSATDIIDQDASFFINASLERDSVL